MIFSRKNFKKLRIIQRIVVFNWILKNNNKENHIVYLYYSIMAILFRYTCWLNLYESNCIGIVYFPFFFLFFVIVLFVSYWSFGSVCEYHCIFYYTHYTTYTDIYVSRVFLQFCHIDHIKCKNVSDG